MHRLELINTLRRLADEARAAGEIESAAILYLFAGALSAHREQKLLSLCVEHAEREQEAHAAIGKKGVQIH